LICHEEIKPDQRDKGHAPNEGKVFLVEITNRVISMMIIVGEWTDEPVKAKVNAVGAVE
jgi:CRISPR/Cas system-associated protein endoribonuclease Cas2